MQIIEASAKESQALLQLLVARNESRHLEFKRVTGKMVQKALETLCAFANTEGGILVLGLADMKGGCKNFCVNGLLAGNCRTALELQRNDRHKRIDRQPAG